MPHNIDGVEYLTIAEAVEVMGCSDGWIRHLLREEKLERKKIGQRLWLVSKASVLKARDALSTRAKGKKHLAKRPAARRKNPRESDS